jgi:hypothetical protein
VGVKPQFFHFFPESIAFVYNYNVFVWFLNPESLKKIKANLQVLSLLVC